MGKRFTCEDYRRVSGTNPTCCVSCHEDYELYGDWMLTLEDSGEDEKSSVCCGVVLSYETADDETQAKVREALHG